jgi:flagellar hook protein FlgE
MSSTFSIALSALQADSAAINITGNNLANLNTNGFKGSTVEFESLMAEATGGGSSGGLGVTATPLSEQVFSQGSLQSSDNPVSAAIQGNGFFVVQTASGQQQFTRDGGFTLNGDGVLQTATGGNVQGWMSTNGVVNSTGAPTNLAFPPGTMLPPKPTQNIMASLNLNAVSSGGSNTFSAPMQVIDSLGQTHTLTISFTQTAPNTWSYNVTIPGSDLNGNQTGNVSVLSGPGTLSFNSDGTLKSSNTSPVQLTISGLADGAGNMSVNWSLFNTNGSGAITQFDQMSGLASTSQDGAQASQLSQVTIGNGGQVMATYSNGEQVVAGQLALASIENPGSLMNVGNNNFAASGQTATPVIGLPQSGGRGQVVGGSLEGSNVDMGSEFTKLIVFQSSYSASSKVISTANTMSQDLLNLIQ